MNRTARRGFTLIELLVVIAIIALLAAILFPVFAKAREKARQTTCLSNMKQMALAAYQYAQDFDEKYSYGVNNAGKGAGWAGQFYVYVKSPAVFRCPDDQNTRDIPGTIVSYCMNSQLSPYLGTGLILARFNNPAKTVMLCEVINSGYYDITIPTGSSSFNYNCDAAHGLPGGCSADVTGANLGGSASGYGNGADQDINGFNVSNGAGQVNDGTHVQYATGYMRNSYGATYNNFFGTTGRHSDGSNFVLCDGHAKWFRGNAVSGGYENLTNIANDCGTTGTAATTTCSDQTIAATFNIL